MKNKSFWYIAKMFSKKHNEYFYLYADNGYKFTPLIADRFETYEECLARIQEFCEWKSNEDFDVNKCKVCKITFIEEEM